MGMHSCETGQEPGRRAGASSPQERREGLVAEVVAVAAPMADQGAPQPPAPERPCSWPPTVLQLEETPASANGETGSNFGLSDVLFCCVEMMYISEKMLYADCIQQNWEAKSYIWPAWSAGSDGVFCMRVVWNAFLILGCFQVQYKDYTDTDWLGTRSFWDVEEWGGHPGCCRPWLTSDIQTWGRGNATCCSRICKTSGSPVPGFRVKMVTSSSRGFSSNSISSSRSFSELMYLLSQPVEDIQK